MDTWKTRLLCASQSHKPVHKEVTLSENPKSCNAAQVSRCPAEQGAFQADMPWERDISALLGREEREGEKFTLLCHFISFYRV